ncbi:MAG: aminotransferase class V-fold PLP-dependent enzyme [Elainella sp.]
MMNLTEPLAQLSASWSAIDSVRHRHHWTLDQSITFLNHGSFGACPRPVLEQQQRFRTQLEQEPVRFFTLELEPLLDRARSALAEFVGAIPDSLAFVPNATTGVNTVLRSLSFKPGDELLTTNHEYNASRNALNFAAAAAGATVVVAEVPFPLAATAAAAEEQMVNAILAKVSARTRLVLLDHVTSQTALIFPIQRLVAQLKSLGVEVLIDGAHAPGQVSLDLDQLGAAYYTGNCHKWLCAPKGAAFLYVRPDKRESLRPLVISHGANSPRTDRSRFHLEFDWVGTADPTPYLCIPTAIDCLAALVPGGWPALMVRNHRLALAVRQAFCQQFRQTPLCPEALISSMAVIACPITEAAGLTGLQTRLFERFQIEIPVIPWSERQVLIRFSVQLYNQASDYVALAAALTQIQPESS